MNDQHVTAIAAVIQSGLLLASAILVAWYLVETRKLRITSQHQVSLSQKQVDATLNQVKVSMAQAEAQIRPALVLRSGGRGTFQIVNVGSGPAFNLQINTITGNNFVGLNAGCNISRSIAGSFVVVGESGLDAMIPTNYFAVNQGLKLQLDYSSLSGTQYGTLTDFDENGVPTRTLFPPPAL